MVPAAAFLIVDDESYVAHRIADAVRPYGEVRFAATLADARRLLETMEFCAAILDVGLPDGSGLDLLEALRRRDPELPVLVVTGTLDRDLVNRVQALRAEYVCKPWTLENLTTFADRARTPRDDVAARAERRAEALITTHRLSHREAAIVRLLCRGKSRDEVREELGIAENTLKTVVRRLLAKTGHTSLTALALAVYGPEPPGSA